MASAPRTAAIYTPRGPIVMTKKSMKMAMSRPARGEALDRHVLDKNTTVLDYGCGTGLSGQALLNVGFQAVDGLM